MGKKYKNKNKPKREGRLVTVGSVAALPEGRGATVKLKGNGELALFNVKGKFYALENFCPHKAAPLADSRLYGSEVECSLHGWRFDVRTGACFKKKGCSIEAYEVVEDEMIKVLV